MRFITREEEFNELRAEALEKLTQYMEVLQFATYEDLKDQGENVPLTKTYSAAVKSNAAFKAFMLKNIHLKLLANNIS